PARRVLGDQGEVHSEDKYISLTPTAAAVRRIVPRLPGSCTASSSTAEAESDTGCVGRGGVNTTRRPTGAWILVTASNNVSASTTPLIPFDSSSSISSAT